MLLISFMDAAAFGIPMDPLMAYYIHTDPHRWWLYTLLASLGSAAGSMVPFGIGHAGGELVLLKRIDRQRFERIRDRFEKQEFLALMIPAMLPPPTPFKLFVLSAGVFEMKARDAFLAIFSGRLLRFGILSFLVIKFGPQIVTGAKNLFTQHPGYAAIAIAVVLALVYIVYRLLKAPMAEIKHELEERK